MSRGCPWDCSLLPAARPTVFTIHCVDHPDICPEAPPIVFRAQQPATAIEKIQLTQQRERMLQPPFPMEVSSGREADASASCMRD